VLEKHKLVVRDFLFQ